MRERTIDIYAKDFLSFANNELGIKASWMPKVKALYCTERSWTWLWNVYSQTVTGNPQEYPNRSELNPENWQRANGVLFRLMKFDTEGRWVGLSEGERLILLTHKGFDREQAEGLVPFDAIIFLNSSRLIEAAKRGNPCTAHSVVAHECIHILESLSGRTIIKGVNPNKYFEHPIVVELLKKFVDETGLDEFNRRYTKEN